MDREWEETSYRFDERREWTDEAIRPSTESD
jgi:hypothetical protein